MERLGGVPVPASHNNAVRAYARLRRATEYTAPKACRIVTALTGSSGAWPRDVRAGAASRTSERYAKARERSDMCNEVLLLT